MLFELKRQGMELKEMLDRHHQKEDEELCRCLEMTQPPSPVISRKVVVVDQLPEKSTFSLKRRFMDIENLSSKRQRSANVELPPALIGMVRASTLKYVFSSNQLEVSILFVSFRAIKKLKDY